MSPEKLIVVVVIILIVVIIIVISVAADVKGKARSIDEAYSKLHVGMSESELFNVLGTPDKTGVSEDGAKIYGWSVDTKKISGIFATNTFHSIKVTVKVGKVVGWEGI